MKGDKKVEIDCVVWHVVEGKTWVMNILDFVTQHVHTLSLWQAESIGCVTLVRPCIGVDELKWDKNYET